MFQAGGDRAIALTLVLARHSLKMVEWGVLWGDPTIPPIFNTWMGEMHEYAIVLGGDIFPCQSLYLRLESSYAL